MQRYEVTVWFKDKTVYVTAKNAGDAKKKAYKKFNNKKASSLIDKTQTEVY